MFLIMLKYLQSSKKRYNLSKATVSSVSEQCQHFWPSSAGRQEQLKAVKWLFLAAATVGSFPGRADWEENEAFSTAFVIPVSPRELLNE